MYVKCSLRLSSRRTKCLAVSRFKTKPYFHHRTVRTMRLRFLPWVLFIWYADIREGLISWMAQRRQKGRGEGGSWLLGEGRGDLQKISTLKERDPTPRHALRSLLSHCHSCGYTYAKPGCAVTATIDHWQRWVRGRSPFPSPLSFIAGLWLYCCRGERKKDLLSLSLSLSHWVLLCPCSLGEWKIQDCTFFFFFLLLSSLLPRDFETKRLHTQLASTPLARSVPPAPQRDGNAWTWMDMGAR